MDDLFKFDNRPKPTRISNFLFKIRDFSTISDQQTVDECANHSETTWEARRRALVTVEVLWWPNQVRQLAKINQNRQFLGRQNPCVSQNASLYLGTMPAGHARYDGPSLFIGPSDNSPPRMNVRNGWHMLHLAHPPATRSVTTNVTGQKSTT